MLARSTRWIGLAVLALFAATGSVQAQDAQHATFDGPWEVTFDSQMGQMTVLFQLEADGAELSGVAEAMAGEGIVVGTQEGDALEFTLMVDQPDHQVELHFSGKIEEDAASGAVSIMGETYEWTAQRADG